MGITRRKVSALLRGEFSYLCECKLMDCLNRLGYDIEIKVRPAAKRVKHLKLALVYSIVCVNRDNTDRFATRKCASRSPVSFGAMGLS